MKTLVLAISILSLLPAQLSHAQRSMSSLVLPSTKISSPNATGMDYTETRHLLQKIKMNSSLWLELISLNSPAKFKELQTSFLSCLSGRIPCQNWIQKATILYMQDSIRLEKKLFSQVLNQLHLYDCLASAFKSESEKSQWAVACENLEVSKDLNLNSPNHAQTEPTALLLALKPLCMNQNWHACHLISQHTGESELSNRLLKIACEHHHSKSCTQLEKRQPSSMSASERSSLILNECYQFDAKSCVNALLSPTMKKLILLDTLCSEFSTYAFELHQPIDEQPKSHFLHLCMLQEVYGYSENLLQKELRQFQLAL